MILADKIINERKKNGWSQEELAEQLSVSRQSVSKWESAQAVPDLQRIIQMADVFNVSTDYLLKDELEPQNFTPTAAPVEDVVSNPPLRKVSLEDANEYLAIEKRNAPKVANAVSMCIVSPVLLIFLAGLSESEKFGISENLAAGIGVISLLILIAVAVFVFIVCDAKSRPFEFLESEPIETEYGVTGMVNEKKKSFDSTHTCLIALGVVLCILSAVPLLAASFMETAAYVVTSMVSVLLILVAAGVNLFVRAGSIWESFDKLLQEGEFTPSQKKAGKITGKVSGIYWCLATAVYLGWSFWTNRWDFTWIVWPVAGVLFGVVITITKMIIKAED